MERASLFVHDNEIKPAELLVPEHFPAGHQTEAAHAEGGQDTLPLHEVTRRHILEVLEACGGNKSLTARRLEISLSTLKRKLKEMGHETKGTRRT